jgi:hypothetical protein
MAFPVFIENSMFHLPRMHITRPYRTSVTLEEERPWVGFYRRVANPAIAAEIIQHFDGDAAHKRIHPALYLRCKESLRKKKVRRPVRSASAVSCAGYLAACYVSPRATCARNHGTAPVSSLKAWNRCASLLSMR